MFWGFSEALDLLTEYEKHFHLPAESLDELNILLYGGGDARHILQTIAKVQLRQRTIRLNFYVLEGCLEIVARQMLLLNLAFEPPDEFSLKGKTHTFMDLYGNALLRPLSNAYLAAKSSIYSKAITDLEGFAWRVLPVFNFSHLKYSERDTLENIFTFWQNRSEHIFQIAEYWDQRVKENLGTRFDYRNGVFDWDLSMKLRDYGGQQICAQEYKHWRDTGVAFVYPEFEQTFPNKTLAAALHKNGKEYRHRGYVGDITVGPFSAFGVKCADESMKKSNHGTNQYRATDITFRNLMEIMFEIQERQAYQHDTKQYREFGASSLQISKHMPAITDRADVELKKYDQPIMNLPNLSITFLSLDNVMKIQSQSEFQRKFDVVFVAQNYFPFVKESFVSILSDKALVLFETKQMSVLRKEDISEFLEKIKDLAKSMGLDAATHFNINVPLPIIRYKHVLKK